MEERIFLISDDKSVSVSNNICVQLPFESITDKIILCPDFQSNKEKELNDICSKYRVKCKIQRSELNAKSTAIVKNLVIEKVSEKNPWRFCDLR